MSLLQPKEEVPGGRAEAFAEAIELVRKMKWPVSQDSYARGYIDSCKETVEALEAKKEPK
jgi:hypothetical protein